MPCHQRGVVGDLPDVGMTALALYLGMHTVIEDGLVHIEEPELALLIYPAEAGILMAQKTVADIRGKRNNRDERRKQQKE